MPFEAEIASQGTTKVAGDTRGSEKGTEEPQSLLDSMALTLDF